MTDSVVPLLIALLPNVVAVAAIVAAELRDRRRVIVERESRLRDERIAAYRKLLAAASSAHVEREGVEALAEAYAEIGLLAGSNELDRVAAWVWTAYGKTQRSAEEHTEEFAQALDEATTAKDEFLKLAREELGLHPHWKERNRGSPPTLGRD